MKKIMHTCFQKREQINLLFFILIAAFLMSSCNKVGEEDPSISLNSRDNRLAGDWELNAYTLTESIIKEINFSFNTLLCDTGNISTLQKLNQEIESSYIDSTLTSKFVETDGGIGTTKIFDIELHYDLEINKNGTYACSGRYIYKDNVQDATVSGGFDTQNGSWFWEEDSEAQVAVTFTNFPIINIKDLETNNSPIERTTTKTFELLRLASRTLKLEETFIFSDTNTVSFDPYTIALSDTIFSCTQFREVVDKVNTQSIWTFKQ